MKSSINKLLKKFRGSERLRGAFTTRRYTNPRLPLPLPSETQAQWTDVRAVADAKCPH